MSIRFREGAVLGAPRTIRPIPAGLFFAHGDEPGQADLLSIVVLSSLSWAVVILASAQVVQDNAAIALDWITGVLAFVTAVMAIATVVLGIKTAASVEVAKESVLVAKQEADATLELARGAHEERELGVRPVVYAISNTVYDLSPELKDVPMIVVRNIGRGPAIRTRVIRWYGPQVALHRRLGRGYRCS